MPATTTTTTTTGTKVADPATRSGSAHLSLSGGTTLAVSHSQAEVAAKRDSHAVSPSLSGHVYVGFDVGAYDPIVVDLSTIQGVSS